MEISTTDFADNFEGFQIIDCVVRSDNVFYFSLVEDYTKRADWTGGEGPATESLAHRIVCYAPDDPPEERWSHAQLEGFTNIAAGVSDTPKEQFVGVDLQGHVYVLGSGDDKIEESIQRSKDNGIKRGAITRARAINGVLYIAGSGRSVGYRHAANSWISLTQGMPYNRDSEWNTAGFLDIDGFSASDIYCVGGKGDVWKFDGKAWSRLHFPSNIDLYTVCCAGDGTVYVSGSGGATFKGRDNKWKKIYDDTMTIPFKRMAWHSGKVWCTSDYGLWTIENDKVIPADVSDEVKVASGYLSVKGETLLLGGYNGAAYCRAGKWKVIF